MKRVKIMKTMKWDKLVVEELKSNNDLLEAYIEDSINKFRESGDIVSFSENLKYIIEAKGGIAYISKKSNLSRSGLYRMLQNQNFKIDSFLNVLHSVGIDIDFKPYTKYKYV